MITRATKPLGPRKRQLSSCSNCGKPAARFRKTCGSPECIRERQASSAIKNRKFPTPTERSFSYRLRQKLAVLGYYSSSTYSCKCCGESRLEFLTIDHINGGGAKHREELGQGRRSKGAGGFYYWLIRSDYPEGYQVLCQNCNFSRGLFGYCPHDVSKKDETPLDTFVNNVHLHPRYGKGGKSKTGQLPNGAEHTGQEEGTSN